MGDHDHRVARGRYLASGALEDETRALRARVRAGELDPARLLLAAYLGHPGAGACFGLEPESDLVAREAWLRGEGYREELERLQEWVEDWNAAARAFRFPMISPLFGLQSSDPGWGAFGGFDPPSELGCWIHGLSVWGPSAVVRAGLAVCRATLPWLEGEAVLGEVEEVLDRTCAWVVCPGPDTRRAILDVLPLAGVPEEAGQARTAAGAIGSFGDFAQYPDLRHVARVVGLAADQAAAGFEANGPATLAQAVADELLPWALSGQEIDPEQVRSLQGELGEADRLQQRLSRGSLSRRDLELLAYVGLCPARLVLGQVSLRDDLGSEGWAQGVAPLGHEAAIRVALAAARAVESAWEAECPGDPRVANALDAVEAWLEEDTDLDPTNAPEAPEDLLNEPAGAACLAASAAFMGALTSDEPAGWAAVDAVREARRALRLERERAEETPTEVELNDTLARWIRDEVADAYL